MISRNTTRKYSIRTARFKTMAKSLSGKISLQNRMRHYFHFMEESFVFGRSAVFENNETQNTDVDNVIDWEDDIVEKIREITGISSGNIRYSDVSNTQTFDLSDSTVKDISVLKNLSDLEYLNIAGCPIEDYSPIEGLHIDEVFK